jgi:DNA-binding Lrp family transcriptional regulator
MTLDDFDARILNELQANSDLTTDVIGQRVGLSGSAVTKRLKRLNSSGLIECHVAVLNERLIGPFVQALDALPARGLRQPDALGDLGDGEGRVPLQEIEDLAIDQVHGHPSG